MTDQVLEVEQIAISTEQIYRLSVAQYHAMIDAGVLTEDDPVELIEGWLVEKMPKNLPHSFSTQTIRDELAKILSKGWFVSDQESFATPASQPEPDGLIIRGTRRDYTKRRPTGTDLALVIEVSDSTLRYDRTTKKQIYAKSGIPIYWIVNLVDRQIEVFTTPENGNFQKQQIYPEASMIPVVIDQVQVAQIAVSELLP